MVFDYQPKQYLIQPDERRKYIPIPTETPIPTERPVPGKEKDGWPPGLPFPTQDQIDKWQREIDNLVWEKIRKRHPD